MNDTFWLLIKVGAFIGLIMAGLIVMTVLLFRGVHGG
jgi:hypothetical protein